MREEVTNHVLLGRKSHGGPYYAENRGSEQTVWQANIEVRRINEYCIGLAHEVVVAMRGG